jgi:glycosyltransferase involved in cell wall biosynthesis
MTTMEPQLVSVLTPSFNQAPWIEDNLRSVATQTYERIEHVIFDGGSTDRTIDILVAQGSPTVRWWSEADDGQAHAINKAFAQAQGEIIGWLNSDDAYFSRDVVASVVEAFRLNPDVDVVYGHAALVNADGMLLHVAWVPPMSRWVLRMHNFICQPAVFIRRRAIGVDLVDPTFQYMMDAELWLRLSTRLKFIRLNRILAVDRNQPLRKSITRPDLEEQDRRRLEVIYPAPSGMWVRPIRKLIKVAFRFAGLSRIPEAIHASRAYDGWVDGVGALILRQAIAPRSRMPLSSARGQPASRPDAAR